MTRDHSSSHARTAAKAEADVEKARADLSATLDQLRTNLRPSNLVHEVMAKPRHTVTGWIALYNRFATHSPASGVIIGAAALLFTASVFRSDGARK